VKADNWTAVEVASAGDARVAQEDPIIDDRRGDAERGAELGGVRDGDRQAIGARDGGVVVAT